MGEVIESEIGRRGTEDPALNELLRARKFLVEQIQLDVNIGFIKNIIKVLERKFVEQEKSKAA